MYRYILIAAALIIFNTHKYIWNVTKVATINIYIYIYIAIHIYGCGHVLQP